MLTNQKGELLFQTDDLESQIMVEIDKNDIVNLTIGEEIDGSFLLNTYRNVVSGFFKETDSNSCWFGGNDETYGSKLVITGINDYDEIIAPSFDVDIDKTDTSLVLTMGVETADNVHLMILPKGASDYKSFIFDYKSWDGSQNIVVNYSDFVNTVSSDITVEATDIILFSKAISVDLDGNSTYLITKNMNKKILVFQPENFNKKIATINLSVKAQSQYYSKNVSTLPSDIELFDPTLELNGNLSNYHFSVDKNYDVIDVIYNFDGNSYWSFHQYKELSSSFDLPNIPVNILDKMQNLKESLNNENIEVEMLCLKSNTANFTFTPNYFRTYKLCQYESKSLRK